LVSFKLIDDFTVKQDYTYLFKVEAEDGAVILLDELTTYTFKIVCGPPTIIPSEIPESSFTIADEHPVLTIPYFGTHSTDCPIEKYELYSDLGTLSLDFD